MEDKQKNRIIQRFLIEKNHSLTNTDHNLLILLDHIVTHHQGLFQFDTIDTDEKHWKLLKITLEESCVLFLDGSCAKINLKKAESIMSFLRNKKEIQKLPKDNYSVRTVSQPASDPVIEPIINQSRRILYRLIQNIKGAKAFDPTHNEQVLNDIQATEKNLAASDDKLTEKMLIQQKLMLLCDLNKLNRLKPLAIPQDNGSTLIYYTLDESIKGATKKIPLISTQQLKQQLTQLCSKAPDLNEYQKTRRYFELKANAIIKCPKHGDVREIQHEAIALNCSRLLKLHTTHSTTINRKGRPALFIPFDKISLLNHYTAGITLNAGFGWQGKTYTHYSTIKALGEGMQGDCFIDDFGKALGLIYLCSDTDALGGYCQNKGLINNKSLYIFDQVMMETDKFILDSRFSLQPCQFFMRHTRHGQGRNRTLVEDSLFNAKFESVILLKQSEQKIIQYMNQLIQQHQQRILKINQALSAPLSSEQRKPLQLELDDLSTLEKDAIDLKTIIQERLNQINHLLPQTQGPIDLADIRQGFVLEKLLHLPVLFSNDGRPYKNPWTYRQNNHLMSMTMLDNNKIQLNFSSAIPESRVDFIKRRSTCDSLNYQSEKSLVINKSQLHLLTEHSLTPEYQLIPNSTIDYLDHKDLEILSEAYGQYDTTPIIKILKEYLLQMKSNSRPLHQKLQCIKETESTLKKLISASEEKGFGMNALKKFYFHSQLHLQRWISPNDTQETLNRAFSNALKLDRVSEFQNVLITALSQNQLKHEKVMQFINHCLNGLPSNPTYIQAKKLSKALDDWAKEVKNQLKNSPNDPQNSYYFFNQTTATPQVNDSKPLLNQQFI